VPTGGPLMVPFEAMYSALPARGESVRACEDSRVWKFNLESRATAAARLDLEVSLRAIAAGPSVAYGPSTSQTLKGVYWAGLPWRTLPQSPRPDSGRLSDGEKRCLASDQLGPSLRVAAGSGMDESAYG
jgi:hypothetical protein